MAMKVDLHIHTVASDGCWSPQELIEQIKLAGVSLFSATDHDSVGSINDLLMLAPKTGLHFISGIEITSKFDGRICHILGYGIDPASPPLLAICEENTQLTKELNAQQIQKFIDKGMPLDIDEFLDYKFDKRRGGGAAINFLVDKGIFPTFQRALDFVTKNAEWNTSDFPPPEKAVSIIKGSGGHPILAHPGSTLLSEGLSDEDIETLVGMGIEGLECYTSYHNEKLIQRYLAFCRKRDLLITAGSDCHGPLLKERVLGQPEARLEDLDLTGVWPT